MFTNVMNCLNDDQKTHGYVINYLVCEYNYIVYLERYMLYICHGMWMSACHEPYYGVM